jgi:hypothetical protein
MSLSANHFWCVAIVIIWFKNQSFWSVPPFSLLLDSSLNPRFPIAYLLNPWFPRFFAKCVRNKKKKIPGYILLPMNKSKSCFDRNTYLPPV